MTSIPAYLFYFVNITSVTIGSNVESIGEDVFYGCSSLTGVYINDLAAWCTISFGNSTANPLYNAEDLYLNGELVTELVIPDGVTSIGSYAFYDCSGLMEITLPDSVTSIGSSAFYNCYKLIEVYNQSALDIVAGSRDNGYVAYYAKNVYTQEEGKSWFTDTAEGYRFFYDGSKGYLMEYNGTETELILPAAFTAYNGTEVTEYEIYKYAFYERKDLITVTIPDSVTSIGSSAFDDCSGLTEITIPEGVTSIGSRAFYNCSGLTEITIPAGVTSIGSSAFYNCSGLTEITIPAGVTSIGSYAFYNCSGLTEINYNAAAVADCGDLVFCDAGSNPEGCTIIFGESVTSIPADLFARGASAYVSNFVSVTIGSNVKSIGSSAFDGCSSLTSVTIGEGVTSIGSSAFRDCSGLTEITIPDSVMSIGLSTFYGCSSLTSVTIGEGVTSIGLYAFRHCSGLTEITIPAGVTSIGSSAFEGCSKLTSVTFENTEGWWYASSSGATSGTEIASSDLADPSTAATYLKSRYYNYYWHRS